MTIEANQAAGAVAPAAPPTSVQTQPLAAPPAVVPPPAAPPAIEGNPADPNWLNGRIAKAKQSAQAETLKALGVDNIEAAKAAIAAAKAKADSEKTAEQRAAELKTQLDGETARSAEQAKVIAEYAARQMVGLSAEQKAAVIAVAGEDAGKQLSAIAALQPTWSAAPAATSQVVPPQGNAPSQAPIDTAPPRTAPAGSETSAPDHRATYEAARKANPFAAAEYGLRNADAVYKTK